MTPNIIDAEVQVLASIATVLKAEYIREGVADPWAGSPFAWVRTMASRRVGKIGEQLVSGWCAAKGLDVLKSPDSDADRIIGSRRVEIKFSTLWESGTYTFQQFRDQNYEYAICLGVSPFAAHCWVLPKNLILSNAIPQHAGRGGSDTFWITFPPQNPPQWMAHTGGTLSQAFQQLQRLNTRNA